MKTQSSTLRVVIKIFCPFEKLRQARERTEKLSWICKSFFAWIYTPCWGMVGKGRINIWIQSLKTGPWILGPALWNMQAKTKTGNVFKVDMPWLVTVSIITFSWFYSQDLFNKLLIYFDIPCYFPQPVTLFFLTRTFLQIPINLFLKYVFIHSWVQRWYLYDNLKRRKILSPNYDTSNST